MGMLGLRDVFVVAPTAPFHQAAAAHHEQLLSAAEAHPLIPLLAAAPYLPDDPRPSKINLSWQTQPPPLPQNPNPNSTTAPSSSGFHSSTPGATTCQDCGNQAKKDCTHRRCRTCCKSRGFDCSTHIKSTWVPASRRRERHLAISAAAAAGSSASTSASKKPRIFSSQTTTNSHTSNSNTPSRSFDTSSSHQDASFRENLPGHVRAPALFRCVRVASIDGDGEDEYAYHAKVTIGGHVFKGFLYDQGVDDGSFDHTGATSTAADANAHNNISAGVPKISELNLSAGISVAGVRRGGSSSFAAPPSHIFGESAGVARMLDGSAFGNAIN